MKRALLLLLAFVAMQATSRADGTVASETAHYRLVSTGTQAEADDWTRMLEAAWPQYEAFFGKTPTLAKDAKLSVEFFETLADMQAAIRRAGGSPPPDDEPSSATTCPLPSTCSSARARCAPTKIPRGCTSGCSSDAL